MVAVAEQLTEIGAPSRRSFSKARWRRPSGFNVVVALTSLVVAFLVIYPLGRMLVRVFWVDGRLSLEAYNTVFADPAAREAVRNTGIVVGSSVVLAVVLASLFAWCNERTDARFGWLSDILPVLPLLIPGLATSVGAVFLFTPRAGLVNSILRDALGVVGIHLEEGPIDIYSMYGLVFFYTVFLVPFAYLPIAAGLRNLDPSYEEASRSCGAGLFTTLRRVTLPAVWPSIAAGAFVSLVVGAAVFTIPAIIGTSAGIELVSVRVYEALTSTFPPRYDEAIAMSTIVLVVIVAAYAIQRKGVRSSGFATISGRARAGAVVRLGKWRLILRLLMLGYVAITSVLPLIALFIVSIQPFWGEHIRTFDGNLDNFRDVFFEDRASREALTNSARLGATGATILVIVVAAIAVGGSRRVTRWSTALGALMKLPAALPHLVISVAFIAGFTGEPFKLEGTLTILLLAYAVFYVPQASVIIESAALQVAGESVEASAICGARPARTFRRIQLPLLIPGLAAAWTLCFVLMVGDITGSALLSTNRSPVVGAVILHEWQFGSFGTIAALSTVITVMTTTVVVAVQWFVRRHGARSLQ